jgi:MOSC domain-containing protein YiiM
VPNLPGPGHEPPPTSAAIDLVSVATGVPTVLASVRGEHVWSGIRKQPVAGAVEVRPLGLAGDEQADLSVHGGLSKAVYAYPSEHYPFW